jgi:hypothetical protein
VQQTATYLICASLELKSFRRYQLAVSSGRRVPLQASTCFRSSPACGPPDHEDVHEPQMLGVLGERPRSVDARTPRAGDCYPRRVRTVYSRPAFSAFLADRASRIFNARRINRASQYDSPPLHHSKTSVINRLQPFTAPLRYRYVPIVFQYWRRGTWNHLHFPFIALLC